MNLTRFDKAAAGTNMEEKKLCDPKNLKWQFLLLMKTAVWQLCNRRKELGIFLEFL